MIEKESYYYFKFPNEIEDRLDFVHHHPELDDLKHLDKITCFKVYKFSDDVGREPIILYIASGSTPKGIKYVDSGVMFLGAGSIKEGRLDLAEVTRIDPSYHNGVLSSSQLKRNDVLITMAGTIGRVCIFDKDEEANINQAIAKVEINTNIVIGEYLSKYLNSKYGQKGFLKHRHDVSQPNINIEEIQRIKIILPPKNVQEQIINKTKPIEDEATDFELKAEQNLYQADKILSDELGVDLPRKEIGYFFKKGKADVSDYYCGFSDKIQDRFHYLFNHPKLEILDELKNKYQTVLLKDICREPIKRGEQPQYSDFGVMVIKTVDLKNRFIDYENTLRVSEDVYESKPQAHIQKNDVLVSSTGYVSVGKINVFDLDEPAFVDGHIAIIRLNQDYDPYFVTYFLRSPLGQIQFEKWFTGSSGQIEVQPEDLNKFLLPSKDTISKDKQKEIADKITEEYKRAWGHEQQAHLKWQEAKELFEKLILEGVENV